MLRMGKLTDYATVVLASLAQEPARHRAAAELARTHALEPAHREQGAERTAARRHGDLLARRAGRLSPGARARSRSPRRRFSTCSRARSRSPNAAARRANAASSGNAGSEAPGSASTPAIRRALEEVTLRQLAGLDSRRRLRVADACALDIRRNPIRKFIVSSKSQDVEALHRSEISARLRHRHRVRQPAARDSTRAWCGRSRARRTSRSSCSTGA